MTMREKFISGKEEIATNQIDITSKEGLKASLELVYDLMIDIHKEFVSTEANDIYCDFFDRADPNYVPVYPEEMFASLKMPHEGHPMFMAVQIDQILPTGIVVFTDPLKPKKQLRLFADELMNYRSQKLTMIDSRDEPYHGVKPELIEKDCL